MSTSIHFPQDVIEDILRLLDSETDKATLQACALTSHMLLPTSQKLLFSIVHLPDSMRVDRLHEICVSKSEIPSFIRQLHLTMPRLEEDGGDKLPEVLGMLNDLQSLVLGRSDLCVGWNRFVSAPLEPSVERLIKLPSLQGVTLHSIAFPYIFPPMLALIKNLTLIDVQFSLLPRGEIGVGSLTQLESLHLINLVPQIWGSWPFSNMPNLRELVIERGHNIFKRGDISAHLWNDIPQAVVKSSAESLKHIVHANYIEYCMHNDFWAAKDLQRLSFAVDTLNTNSFTWGMIPTTIYSATCLEELDMGYTAEKWHPIKHLRLGKKYSVWALMDSILGDRTRFPRLRTFKFYVHPNPSVTEEELTSMLKSNLPLFSVDGTICAKFIYGRRRPVNHKGIVPISGPPAMGRGFYLSTYT